MQRILTCPHCGIEFTAWHHARVYCSGACRTAECRDRQAQAAPLEVRAWEGTSIQRRRIDGFVNATAMCKANGKRWNHYQANERSQEYIAALTASLTSAGNPADPIRTITNGPNELRGTWVHPRLAVDLARWISPAFAVWMDGWFLEVAQGRRAPVQPKRQPVQHRALPPERLTWGDRLTLSGVASTARAIDSTALTMIREDPRPEHWVELVRMSAKILADVSTLLPSA